MDLWMIARQDLKGDLLELFCYDGYAWAIVCQRSFSEKVKEALPMAKDPDAFYAETQG